MHKKTPLIGIAPAVGNMDASTARCANAALTKQSVQADIRLR
jgi:hypothetical protein